MADGSVSQCFSFNLESSIKALAINRDGHQVVAAGRNLFRIFDIESDRFVERESLRFSKKNLNCVCTDVAWSAVDEEVLASSTTSGTVCVWNLGATAIGKQEQTYTAHRRAANRICFHPKEPHILLSGSQDATAVMLDLRKKESSMEYHCEEAVRDVRFSPHQYFQFAVSLENGNVKLFDMRKADVCEREFTCHTGPVFQSHFHPTDKSLIATCGRDKCIKVWNVMDNRNPALEYFVPTVAPMGTIAWRTDRRYHVASTALMTDFSISVWDLRRPYVPFASFEKHTDLVTSLIWREDPHVLLAGSKDGYLSQFSFQEAKRPADKLNPVGLSIGCYGDVAQACSKRIINGEAGKGDSNSKSGGLASSPKNKAEEFLLNCTSKLSVYSHDDLKFLSMDWFVCCAREYQLYGLPIPELCHHNAMVADSCGRSQVAQVWRIVGSLYSAADNRTKSAHPSGEPRSVRVHHRTSDSKRDDTPVNRTEDGIGHSDTPAESAFVKRNLLLKEPMSMGLEPPTSNTGDYLFCEQAVFEEAETPFSGMDSIHDEDNWRLPSEGFQLRSELPERSFRLDSVAGKVDLNRSRNRSGSLGPDDPYDDALRLGSLLPNSGSLLDLTDLVQETIMHHAEQTDLQTAISLIIVLGDRARGMVKESLLEAWLLEYIDLLHHFELFTVANLIIKLCHVSAVGDLNQQSTSVYTSCNNCAKHLPKAGWYCTGCKKLTNSCSICQLPVRGVYVWCQGCQHGGHLEHIQEWLKKSPTCPTGCGHYCEYI